MLFDSIRVGTTDSRMSVISILFTTHASCVELDPSQADGRPRVMDSSTSLNPAQTMLPEVCHIHR